MWDIVIVKDKMDVWLLGFNGFKIEVVICNNDGMVLGVVELMKVVGKVLFIFGVDVLLEVLVKIEVGEMVGIVFNDVKG